MYFWGERGYVNVHHMWSSHLSLRLPSSSSSSVSSYLHPHSLRSLWGPSQQPERKTRSNVWSNFLPLCCSASTCAAAALKMLVVHMVQEMWAHQEMIMIGGHRSIPQVTGVAFNRDASTKHMTTSPTSMSRNQWIFLQSSRKCIYGDIEVKWTKSSLTVLPNSQSLPTSDLQSTNNNNNWLPLEFLLPRLIQ